MPFTTPDLTNVAAAVRLLDEEDYLKVGRVFEIMLRAFMRNMERSWTRCMKISA